MILGSHKSLFCLFGSRCGAYWRVVLGSVTSPGMPWSLLRLISFHTAVGLSLFLAFPLGVWPAPDPRPWTVKVFGASAPGSGVVVRSSAKDALILTAGHVLEGTRMEDGPTVLLPDGRELPILSIRFLEKLDLAELQVAWPNAPYPSLIAQPHPGGTIWIGGYPQGSRQFWLRHGPSEQQGQTPSARPGGYTLFHGVVTDTGLSGAGLYNESGQLVGIHGEADVLRTASGQVFKSGVALGIPITFWNRGLAYKAASFPGSLIQDQLLQSSWIESMGRFDSSLKLLERLLKKFPNERRLLQRRASVLLAQRSYDPALTQLDQLLRRTPNDPALLINRGNALLGLRRPDQALLSYQAALEKEPRLVWGYVNKAKAHQALAQWQAAKESLDRALSLDPRDSAALRERAAVHQHLRQYREALADLNLLVQQRMSDAEVWSRRGVIRGELSDLPGSVDDLTVAIELQPDVPLHRLNRGATLSRLKRWREAVVDFEMARQKLPLNPVLLANLGEALFALGDLKKACAFAKQAVGLGLAWSNGHWGEPYRKQCDPY